jgi:FKBP-type peptidyl-prolyl cis-trans isomerase FkpA
MPIKSSALILLVLGCTFLASCSLTTRLQRYYIRNPVNQTEVEHNKMVKYAIDNRLDVQKTDSGIFYQITGGDNGVRPSSRSLVTTLFSSRLLETDEVYFATPEDKPFKFSMQDDIIKGWKEAISMMTQGSKGIFLVPSHLAYGEEGNGDVPGESILRLDIELVDFYDPAD